MNQGSGGGRPQEQGFNIVYQKSFLDILLRMARENRSGILRSRGAQNRFEIHIERGWIVNVTGEFAGEPSVEEIIARSGFLDRATFDKIVRRIRKTNTPFVSYVIKKDLFSDVFLKRILENVIRERVNRIMEMQNVGIDFEKATPTPLRNLSFIHLPAYLRRFRNEFDVRQQVKARYGDGAQIPRKKAGTAVSFEAFEQDERFDVDARIVYFFINGRRSMRDIHYISGLGYTRAGIAISKLVSAGYLEIQLEPEKAKPRPGVVSNLFFHAALPGLFLALFAGSVAFSPVLKGVVVMDRYELRQAQVVTLFDRAAEVFELTSLRPPRHTGELFDAGLVGKEWRAFKRFYERKLLARQKAASGDGGSP